MNHAVATLFYRGTNQSLSIAQLARYTRLAAWEMDLNVVTESKHEIYPQGASVVIHLNGGHVATHTYPQEQKIFIDCFTGRDDKDPEQFIREFADSIDWGISDLRGIKRIQPSVVKATSRQDRLHRANPKKTAKKG